MKKRVLSIILAAIMIISILPLSVSSALLMGDIDNDGAVKAGDARLALRASVGLETLSENQLRAADTDFDGQVKAADARLILRASVGLETLVAPHTHSYKATVTKAATCTEKGINTFTCECGDSYTEDIPAAGHKSVTDKAVAATCTKEGKTEGSHCSVCNTILVKQNTVAKKAHTPVTDKAVAATCTKEGKTEGSHCSVCNTILVKQNTVAKKAHTPVTDKAVAATCTKTGKTEGSHCSVCGITIKAQTTTNATGHVKSSLDESTVKAATCKEDGYSGDMKCNVCKTVTKKGTVVKSTGEEHVLETKIIPASCTQDGYTAKGCKYCTYVDMSTYVPGEKAPGTHSYSSPRTVDPTCTEQGYDIQVCSVCQDTSISNYVDATGHNYSWNTTKKASCTETGSREGTCNTCSHKATETLALTACVESKPTVIRGSKETNTLCKTVVTCENCKKVLFERDATNKEHNLRRDPGTFVEAGCTTYGTDDRTCNYCPYHIDNYIVADPTGHSMAPSKRIEASCTEDGYLEFSGTCSTCHETLENTKVTLYATGHSPMGVQTCETNVTCSTCNEEIAPALGHDFGLTTAAYNTTIDTFFCKRCGSETENSLDVFNAVVNKIKSSAFTSYSGSTLTNFKKSTIATKYSRFDFGIYTAAIRSLYESEMANTPDTFTPVNKSRLIRYDLPISVSAVSELTKSDIDGDVKVEKLSGINIREVLSEYPDTFTIGTYTYKLDTYKNKTINQEVIKVTIDVKNEKFTDIRNLQDNQKTSLMKITFRDIREETKDFKNENGNLIMTETENGDGYEITMSMQLREITSDAKVTYYFLAETYEPILALYDTYETMDQSIDMSFKFGIFSLNGELDPIVSTHEKEAFIFPRLFKEN